MSAPAVAALVAVLAATCAACARRGPAPFSGGQPVEYVRRTFRSSLAGCADPATGAPAACVQVAVDYVEATRATVELAGAVDAFVRATALHPLDGDDPPPDVESLRDALYDRYRALQAEDPAYRELWRLERSVSVACGGDRVQGLVAVERASIGDQAGVERVAYASFGTLDGERLGLDALVAPENLAGLVDVLEQEARAAPDVSPASVFDRSGAPTAGIRLGEPDQVLICPDELRFRWSAQPSIDVTVPRASVRGLLRADAP